MVRTFLLFIALLIVIGIGLVYSGWITPNRNADGSVTVETRDVSVGTTTTNVQVPVVKMETRQVPVPRVGVENSQANAQ